MAKSEEICFLPLATTITAFFATHACVQEKSRATTLKNWWNFKRFNTSLNSKILLDLIRKMKHLTDQFQLCFFFALATLISYIYFCIGNTFGIFTADNLLVAAYALSCLCIPVPNAVVFSHVTSLFKMWKSCDFECL